MATTTTPQQRLDQAEFYPTRDKYGRPTKRLQYGAGCVFGVVVTLPKSYEAEYGTRYLANNWTAPWTQTPREDGKVREFKTLAEAKKWLRSVVTPK